MLPAEETGGGEPILLIHEFAGDHRSWEPQVRFFCPAFRCVTYAARGYPLAGPPTRRRRQKILFGPNEPWFPCPDDADPIRRARTTIWFCACFGEYGERLGLTVCRSRFS